MSRPCPPLVLLLAAPLNSVNSVAGLCGWALRPGLVLLLAAPGSVCRPCPLVVLLLAAPLNSVNSVAGLCGKARLERALQRERQRKRNLKKTRERKRERKKERKKERKTERKKERKRAARARARARVLWTSSCPCLGRAPELCGWALWPGSVSGSCPPLILVLAAPLNSVAGLCGPAYWRGVWPNKKRCQCRKNIIDESGESRAYQEIDF